jgi:iron uptake system component EfeO
MIPRLSGRRALLAGTILSATVLAASCGGGSSDTATTAASPGAAKGAATRELRFELTDTGCTPAAATVPAGSVKFAVSNPGTTKTDEFEIKNADGIIMGERENLAPGLSSDFTLTLQPGDYVLNCTFQNQGRDNGKVTVTGATAAKAATDDRALARAVADYKAYVQEEADQLTAATRTFVAALRAGDTQRAKDLFGPTRAHYETIEPIAESFGDLDPEIDARVNDVADTASWTGFHRIEKILFTRDTTQGTARYGAKLLADVRDLQRKIPGLELQPAQIANGAVGLLDEVSNSKITGEEDRYSHTDLSDFQANFTGAAEAFRALEPALAARHERALIDQIKGRITAVQDGLDKYRSTKEPSGFERYSKLTDADRRRFSQQIAALAEPLSLVAGKVIGAAS